MLRFIFFVFLCGIAQAADRPNIIVFYTDDHGFADLGIRGVEKDVKTPHLDALARSGVIAKNGYSTAPQCVPSRGGLMTGKFQGRFNLDSNNSSLEGFNKETTIATRLQKAGYTTAQFGKWHLGPLGEIPQHGFKHVWSQHGQQKFSANITLEGEDRPMVELAPTMYHIDGCARAAASIIERHKAQPFFLYIAFRAPHTPLDAPQAYKDRFPGAMPERRRAALGMLAAVDDGVGLITSTLKQNSLTEKTLIFFIGDNGAPLKIHKTDSPLKGDPGGWDGSLNTPLNGEKGMLAEGGMHVPFLIAWPGTIPGGQTYEHPVSALDVAATAAAVADISVKPGDLDGVNLVPHLKGETTKPPHDALMW
ncbi:MAG: sulfatase, partial [Prosthecobacter sp.]